MFEPAVDRLCRGVAGAGLVEVGEDVSGASCQSAAESAQLGQGGRDAAAQRVDHGLECVLPGGPVGVAVGGDDVLVDGPGDLDDHVLLVSGERSVDPGALPIGEERLTGVQSTADPIERVAGMAAVSERGLLDALPGVVEAVAGEVRSARGAVSAVSAGPFPRAASRTGRAACTASGSPRVRAAGQTVTVQGVGMLPRYR